MAGQTFQVKNASTISEIVGSAISIADSWLTTPEADQEIWYRGQCKASYSLSPSLYRPENAGFIDIEPSMISRFAALATPLVQREYDPWEWYFLARHYHVPTRLLDWTESLLVAARFALSEYCSVIPDRLALDTARRQPGGSESFGDESPCIWLLEAGDLNYFSRGEDTPFVPGGDRTKPYLPDEIKEGAADSCFPIAILPRRSNPRLNAQRGMFTVHGFDRRPLNEISSGVPDSGGENRNGGFLLAKILLNRGRLPHLVHELDAAGIDRFSLFPDLDRVGEQVCWEYKHSALR